jgi:hypothetical protein
VAAGVAVIFGGYFAWRYWYFQSLLPNTVYAKSGLPPAYMKRGLHYVLLNALTFCTPLLLPLVSLFALRSRRLAAGLGVLAMAWAFPAYAVVSTGDFMAMGRFLVPGLAFQAILLAWMLQAWSGKSKPQLGWAVGMGLAVVLIGALPGWDIHLVPESIRNRFQIRYFDNPNVKQYPSELAQWRVQCLNTERWRQEGRTLRRYADEQLKPGVSIVAGGIGALGYFSDFTVYDLCGLVTPSVSRRQIQPDEPLRRPGHDKYVPPAFFLEAEPTILYETTLVHTDAAQLEVSFATYAQVLLRDMQAGTSSSYYIPRVIPTDTRSPDGRMRFVGILEKLGARK